MYPGLRPSPSCPRLVPINPGSPPGRQSPQCCGGPRGLSAAGLRQVPPSPPAGGMFRLQLLHIRPPRQRSGPAEPPPQPLPLGTNPPQFDWMVVLYSLNFYYPLASGPCQGSACGYHLHHPSGEFDGRGHSCHLIRVTPKGEGQGFGPFSSNGAPCSFPGLPGNFPARPKMAGLGAWHLLLESEHEPRLGPLSW